MKTNCNIFGTRLREMRQESKLFQREMSAFLEITRIQYQYYESGKSFPTCQGLIKLCKLLNVSADYLLGLSDEMNGSVATKAM
jgi:transcriptional regulator with XRE-family HTH domain